jgi:hypothetical protein
MKRRHHAKPKRRQTPCHKCKGFTVPARRVKHVARDARGRFKR